MLFAKQDHAGDATQPYTYSYSYAYARPDLFEYEYAYVYVYGKSDLCCELIQQPQ
jgi:hypothetical protein